MKRHGISGVGKPRELYDGTLRRFASGPLDAICDMVQGVKALGLETCMTLGMLEPYQAEALADAAMTNPR